MPQLRCTKCGSTHCARVRREGFLQTVIFTRLGRFPWRCQDCTHEFYASARGKQKKVALPKTTPEARRAEDDSNA